MWDSAMEGEDPLPKAANHGDLCDSCYWRMRHALNLIPDLMANMRLKMKPGGSYDYNERVQGGGDGTPAPLRIAPLDSSDALFAKLVSWVDALAEQLHASIPPIRTWMGFSEVQGSRPVSPIAAHDQAAQLTAWFLVRLEEISASSSAVAFHNDVCWGWDDSPGVYKLTGEYGVEPRPLRAADKRECPICGRKEIFVAWPDKFICDVRIICGRCKWVAEPEKYGHYAELFKNA